MQTVTTDGATVQYRLDGDGEETVVFVPDAGVGPWLWSWQAPALAGPYRTLVYAPRGTGDSTAAEPYDVAQFAADLEAVLADAGVRRTHLVGAGLGGTVVLRYAREYGRARSLVLFGVTASGDDVDESALSALHPADRTRLRESLSVAFTDPFLDRTEVVDRIVEWRRTEDATNAALAGHLTAVSASEADALYELTRPALVLGGVDDPVVPLDAVEALAKELPRGRFEPVEGKRFCFIEHSQAVTDAIDSFIDSVS